MQGEDGRDLVEIVERRRLVSPAQVGRKLDGGMLMMVWRRLLKRMMLD